MAELTPLYMDINSVYSGDELGLPWRDIIGEGVVDLAGGDLLVSEKAGTPGLSVDVAAGAAWVLGDTNVDAQPIYRVRNDAVVNKGISPDPSNPRKVMIVAQINDETFAGTGRSWEIQALHGDPAASPVAPDLPDSALELAIVDVGAAATEIVTADITDMRTHASVGGGQAQASGSAPGAWSAYTPTLSVISGTQPTMGTGATRTGTYLHHGTLVFATVYITFGTGGNGGTGVFKVDLPVPTIAPGSTVVGIGRIYDSSANLIRTVSAEIFSSSEVILRIDNNVDGAISSSLPWTWGSGDQISFQAIYQADPA